MRLTSFLIVLLLTLALVNAHATTIQFLPPNLPPMRAGDHASVAVVLRNGSGEPTTIALKAPKGITVSPSSRKVIVNEHGKSFTFFSLTANSDIPMGSKLTALIDSKSSAALPIGTSYDLNSLHWKGAFDKGNVSEKQGWMKPAFDDSKWKDFGLSHQITDIGVTYLRASAFVPAVWRGKPIHLRLKAVDDNDVCYLNGVEIGRTNGWDVPRDYKIDPKLVKFGKQNLLCIAVENVNAGGGIYRSPNTIGIASTEETMTTKPQLAPPGKLGKPLPLRKMLVKNGVLYYEDGGDVCLWGVNYYPQSWSQYDNMKRRGVDMHEAIRDDLDDMRKMGVEVIRIHVFDREISDSKGNLIDNEHLELLDYLISEGTKRGIYFMLTPIAWWWGKDQNPQSFSAQTPKEYMFCDDTAIAAEANYVKNWLTHVNRYTGHAHKDQPGICLFEIMNEPAYIKYSELMDEPWTYYAADRPIMPPFKKRLTEKWQKWCETNGAPCDQSSYPLFRYQLMSHYLKTMYSAIRSTGAKQPIACALYDVTGQDDLTEAVADSPCEAITTGHYPGGWDIDSDGVNLLPAIGNTELDSKLDKKARTVYEYDAPRTMDSYLYPAFARRFRNLGVQICCMFQYDSSVTAERNSDWNCHYLNLLYTPSKSVSFGIGGKVFHDLPRGATFPTVGTTQFFGNCAVSFDRNMSLYVDDKSYLCSAPNADWHPFQVPQKPELVMAVGDSPYAGYSGTGIYTLKINHSGMATLTINPDATKVGDPWRPDGVKSVVVLSNDAHPFTLKLAGAALVTVARVVDDTGRTESVPVKDNTFTAAPGTYHLRWGPGFPD